MDIAGERSGRALVLGGGGVTGIAWMAGVLDALDAGISVGDADRIIGTSAGSIVGAFLALGVPPAELATRWLEHVRTLGRFDLRALSVLLGGQVRRDRVRAIQRFGELTAPTSALSHAEFVERTAGHLAGVAWPSRLRVVTVNARTAEPAVWDATSGVPLADAVAASCAVPGVFPAVRLAGDPHLDGGLRSPANVDLAAGSASVIALAPLRHARDSSRRPLRQLRTLPESTRWLFVHPDATATRTIGLDVLSADRREDARDAGRRQGRSALAAARRVWA